MYRIDTSSRPGVAVLSARGELDAFAAPELESALTAVRAATVVVDMSAVAFLDSTALGTLVRAVRTGTDEGRRIAIVLPRGPARRIFEITGLDGALPVYSSLDEALAD